MCRRYKRRSYFGSYLFAFFGAEAYHSAGVFALTFGLVAQFIAIAPRLYALKIFIKGNHKIVMEVFGYTAAIIAGIAYNLAFLGQYLHLRTFEKSI